MVGVRRITEYRRLYRLTIIDLEGQLAGVVIGICPAIQFAARVKVEQRGTSGGRYILICKNRIEVSEEEQAVPQLAQRHIAAELRAAFIIRVS